MADKFISYAHQDLSLKKVKKYAVQYDGVDVAKLNGAEKEHFPFLVRGENDDYQSMWWNAYSGIMIDMNDDEVNAYALIQYLLANGYPRFDSIEEVEAYSVEHNWPRKTR